MDQQSEQAVWRRVRGPGELTAEKALLPERLEALVLEEGALAEWLGSLAQSVRGPGNGVLSRLALQTRQRARGLSALHYLLTGRRLRLRTPRPPKPGPLPEALRDAVLRTRQANRAYQSLEREFEDEAGDFRRYARQTEDNARSLTALLQRQLDRETEGK